MTWPYTTSLNIEELTNSSKPIVIFKHSNRCSISDVAFNRFQKFSEKINDVANVILIDVVASRPLSLEISDYFDVRHESPQAIVIKNGKVVHSSSHFSINAQEIISLV